MALAVKKSIVILGCQMPVILQWIKHASTDHFNNFFKIKENNLIFLLRFTICNNIILDKLVVFFQTRYISNAYHYFLIDKYDMELWIESTKDPKCPLAAARCVSARGLWVSLELTSKSSSLLYREKSEKTLNFVSFSFENPCRNVIFQV